MAQKVDLLDESINPAKVIAYLAWPVILEQILIMLVNYVDTAMVGALGQNATAAVALTSTTSWVFNGIFGGVAVGLSVPIGRYIGAKMFTDASRVARQAVLAIFSIGAVLMCAMLAISKSLPVWMGGDPMIVGDATTYIRIICLGYIFSMSIQVCSSILRCSGDMRTPLIFNVATNVINMILNFFLIYEPRMITVFGASFHVWGAGLGVAGAAIATVIAQGFSGIFLLRALFLESFPCRISIKDKFRFDTEIWGEMLRVGSPVAFERITISIGQVFMTRMVTGLGTASLAAHSLGMTAESITYMPAFGFSVAATTLTSQSLGAGKPELAKRFGRICCISCMILMTTMGFVLFFAGDFLMSIFTPSAEVVSIGAAALKIEALAQPFYALAVVIPGMLRGARKSRLPFFTSLIGMWLVRIPICFIMTSYTALGLPGAWIGMAGDLTVRGLLCLLLLRGGKWADDVPATSLPSQDSE